jgi:hypothetical protein
VPLLHAQRVALFGAFDFAPDPQPGNPEHIHVTGLWPSLNLATVWVPQLNQHATVHKAVAAQFLALWAAWDAAGLRPLVLTFDGAYAPRYKRGMSGPPENLSNHAWGSAFDVNASLNPLGQPGPMVGEHGCTALLEPLANEHGFASGRRFHHRPDPMHFEAYKVLA